MRPKVPPPDDALVEMVATVEALRAGAVDAVVVTGPKGERLYTLDGPNEPYRVFVEGMQQGAVTVDAEGTILYANRFFADLLGRPRDEVLGLSLHTLLATTPQDPWGELNEPGASRRWQTDLRTADEPIPVHIALSALGGSTERLFGVIVTDVRDREQIRRSEAACELAESAHRAKDRFLAMLAHELRTPLSAVVGWSQVLARSPRLSDQEHHAARVIERNATQQVHLVNDLLDVSRFIAGKMVLHLQPCDLIEVANAAFDAVTPAAEEKHLDLVRRYEVASLPLDCDPVRVQQVISNLLVNAVKFTDSGRIELRVRREADEAHIEVEDAGRGIPAAAIPHLFRPFEQGDAEAVARGGLGLGLAIVRQFTELHGGRVQVHSDGPGRGSRFTLVLPVRRVQPAAARPTEALRRGLAGLRVLLVDDDEDTLELVGRMLTRAGCVVTRASSAAEALACLPAVEPQVLVSDLAMPGVNGFVMLREMRARGHGPGKLAAVALTGHAAESDRTRALEAGFQGHVAKPVDPARLYAAVAGAVERLAR